MAGDRLTRPRWTFFCRGCVTDRENEIHHDTAGRLELRNVLGAQARCVMAVALQDLQRKRIQRRTRARSGREGLKLAFAQIAEQRLGKDRAGRVA